MPHSQGNESTRPCMTDQLSISKRNSQSTIHKLIITFIPTSNTALPNTCCYFESYDVADSHYTYCQTNPSADASYSHTAAADSDDYDENAQLLRIHGSRVHAPFPSSASGMASELTSPYGY